MVTQCSSRNFTENLPTWELRAQINSCAIFKALTTFLGAASESTTFFQGLVRQVLTNCICSAPEQTPRQTFLCFNLNTCLRGEVGAQSVLVWISLTAWQEYPSAVTLQEGSVRWLPPCRAGSRFAPGVWGACCVCPPTDLVKNKCAVHSHIDSQRGNSPYLSKYCLLVLDILSEFRQTRDLEYENTMKPRLGVQLVSLYPRNITVRKAGIFVQLLHFIKEEPKHWTCMWLWYIQRIWLLVLCIYTNRKLQEWAKCDNCIEAEGFCM